MSIKPLTIASRASPLAVAQALLVRDLLAKAAGVPLSDREEMFPHKTFVTTGDRSTAPTLAPQGVKGLFTKEIEAALLTGEADIAVHSMKDMPAVSPPGLVIAGVPAREDPRDAFITLDGRALSDMPPGAKIGTSSVRRAAQLLRRRPDLTVVPLRGNVGTRLEKIARGDAEATFLAMAGLLRLDKAEVPRQPLDPEEMLPALGQGVLAVQTREDDMAARALCAAITCPKTAAASAAERGLLEALDGSCKTPMAGLATVDDAFSLTLRGHVLMPDGSAHFAVSKQISLSAQSGAAALSETDLTAASALGQAVADALRTDAGDALRTMFTPPNESP